MVNLLDVNFDEFFGWYDDCANWPFIPNLKVPVVALHHYYKEEANPTDEWSRLIRESKQKDLSVKFFPQIKRVFTENRHIKGADLTVVVPSHRRHGYSETMLKIASLIQDEFSILNDNLLSAISGTLQSTAGPARQRWENVKNSMNLNHCPKSNVRKIILLDDIKSSGCTLLACQQKILFCESPENKFEIRAVCLGLNQINRSGK